MFVDQADIEVIAGDGGNGSVSFRREKYVPHGGPNGGDGGRGGSVYLVATAGVDTLLDMAGRHHWRAERGGHGLGKKMAGADGRDLIIRVPPGTLVYDRNTGLLLADLKEPGQKVRAAQGGKAGRGNLQFVTSVHQAPDHAEQGGVGQRRELHLELRLIADVGLVGLPNAGKSTLLSRLSAAKPKIADYPFTTLVPQLGIAELTGERRLVIADIPGLIEGASAGAGLGQDFLRHIERTRVIVHLIDVLPTDGSDPVEAYKQIRAELEAYSPKLAQKPEILAANKMDLAGASEALADIRGQMRGRQIFAISAVAGSGLRPLLEQVWQEVQAAPKSEPFVEAPRLLVPEPAESASAAEMPEPDADSDAALEQEIAAMKADDVRKSHYYADRPAPERPRELVVAPEKPPVEPRHTEEPAADENRDVEQVPAGHATDPADAPADERARPDRSRQGKVRRSKLRRGKPQSKRRGGGKQL